VAIRSHARQRRRFMSGSLALGLLTAISRSPLGLTADRADIVSVLSGNQIRKIVEGLRLATEPLPQDEAEHILALASDPRGVNSEEIQRILNRRTLISIRLDSNGLGQAMRAGADLRLQELGWRCFLVRVENSARLIGPMVLVSPAAIPEGDLQPGIHESHILANDVPETIRVGLDLDTDFDRDLSQWLGYSFALGASGEHNLQGLPLEYLLVQVYCQTGTPNTTFLSACASLLRSRRRFECLGFNATFDVAPASTVMLHLRDTDGAGTVAALVIRDAAGRLFPAPAHRIEPDLGYQPQVYRADGETLRLPPGKYRVVATRGPEYLKCERELVIPAGDGSAIATFELERWIDPRQYGWYSGDPHLHPEGQIFGIISKFGVTPETMARQVRGEGLSVGSILIWAGGYYYERQFLSGHVYQPSYQLPFPEAQRANNVSLAPQPTPHDRESLVRYDVEQAAFPSNRLGHPVLLRLRNHNNPSGKGVYDWPSWNLPVFQWTRAQGGVGGYAHCGAGMSVNSTELPNYEIPALDHLGANECFVDITHGAIDFVAGTELHPVLELNLWYHLLNCGFLIPMIGETDFSGVASCAGMGRTYVKLDAMAADDRSYGSWVEGLRSGQLYFGDGRSHLIDFCANGHEVGHGPLALSKPGHVTLRAKIAARLAETPVDPDKTQQVPSANYWHLERARLGNSRNVAIEVVVNGHPVQRHEIDANGEVRDLSFKVGISRSSWVALRILPSSHTTPIAVEVGGKPIRASRRSAQWCLDCVDVSWQKHGWRIRETERAAAAAAWDHARATYRRIISECEA
jgi:hypothetical protein